MYQSTRIVIAAMAVLASQPVQAASERLEVADASQVMFVATPGTGPAYVWFRNFDQLGGPGWQPCCYNYSIDVSTEGGKAMYAAFLGAYFARQKIVFYVDKNGGAIQHVGWF